MRMKANISGLKELNAALEGLPKSIQRNALRRVLNRAGEPIAQAASANAPRDTGELRDSIAVSARLKNNVGRKEYAEVMRSGGTKDDARAALRGARRAAKGQGSFAEIHVGPAEPQANKRRNAIKRIVQEFGSSTQPGQPYMRPAWDANKGRALEIIKADLAAEVDKAAKRYAKRLARQALKGKGK
ncbi:MAG: HK97-gp10 family putative phage morphogenesis protein [Pigmentiphaga sp.]